jgi:hypothetical protein
MESLIKMPIKVKEIAFILIKVNKKIKETEEKVK